MDNKKTFEVDIDGQKKSLAVLRPTNKQNQQANLVYNRAFRLAIQPEDGKQGAIVRAALEGVVRQQKIWDDAKEARFKELERKLDDGERRLAAGGFRLSEAREVAVQMRRDRAERRRLLSERNALDMVTADAQAENARFNYLLSACTVDAKSGKPYWKDEDAYLADPDGSVAAAAASHLSAMLYGLDDDFEKKLPENAWLLRYGFCDEQLRLTDRDGNLVDDRMRRVDEQGRLLNERGELVDDAGNPLNEDGTFKVVFTPFLDDDDRPLPEPGVEQKPVSESVPPTAPASV